MFVWGLFRVWWPKARGGDPRVPRGPTRSGREGSLGGQAFQAECQARVLQGSNGAQYPFLSIFVQNCPKVYNMICDYFNFFLHFSIAYIKSFQDMYHKFH